MKLGVGFVLDKPINDTQKKSLAENWTPDLPYPRRMLYHLATRASTGEWGYSLNSKVHKPESLGIAVTFNDQGSKLALANSRNASGFSKLRV